MLGRVHEGVPAATLAIVCALLITLTFNVSTARASLTDLISAMGPEAAATTSDDSPTFILDRISFGMNQIDVRQIEGEEDLVSRDSGKPDYYQKLTYTPKEIDGVLIGRASLGTLTFSFCTGRLWEIQLWSGYYDNKSAALAAADTWAERICDRYGDPLPDDAVVVDADGLSYYREHKSDFDDECVRLEQWLVEIDGEEVRIDLFVLPSLDDFQTLCYIECAAYRYDLG